MAGTEIPTSKTKIILPRRRAELLRRARLLDILYDRLDRKLIIVSAPAGYGKTSLLIDLAHESEVTFCWLALDALDSDPQRFLTYLIAAIAERFPQFGGRSRSVLNGMTNFEEGQESLLVTLINEIHDEIPEHFALVIDDFHYLDEARSIQNFVNRFVLLMNENCHIILCSRTLPDLPDIALLVARDEVGGLDLSDLAFQPDEIQALLTQNKKGALTEDQARKLVEVTEGWITGIQFADLAMLRAGKSPFHAPRGVGVSVFDFLGEQVLDDQPRDLQVFLLRSSMLEEFDAALCESVLRQFYEETQDWGRTLETIQQRNLFALPVGEKGQWLRYHHLFRDYLQERYRGEFPQDVTPLLRSLAKQRQDRGEWAGAYQIYQQLGDTEALADLIEEAGSAMYQSALMTLESWLAELPPSLVRRRPALLSLRGAVAYVRGQANEAIKLLDAATAQMSHGGDIGGLAVALVRRGHAHRLLGAYAQAIQDAEEAMRITAGADDMQALYADAIRLRGLVHYRQGHTLQSIQDLEEALDIHQRIKDAAAVPHVMMETGMALDAVGDTRRASALYDKALDIWKQTGNLFYQAMLLNNLGFLHYKLGEYESAVQAFEEGMLCAQQSGYRRMEALIAISMGDLYSEIEDFEVAAQNYRKARELVDQLDDRFLANYLPIAEANLALLKREPERARRILERASMAIQAKDSLFEFGHLQLARGRLSLLENNSQRAIMELMEARRCFTEDGREMEKTWSYIWLAAAYLRAGRTANALQEIGAALEDRKQVSHSAVVAARQAGADLEPNRENREVRSVLRGLFERVDRLDDQLPGIRRQLRRTARTILVPPPMLTIHAFGRGQVWVNGRLVTAREWQTQAVRELFFFFLAMNKPVTKEQVASVLWPDTTEPAKLKLRFKNEIYRLRRAVGQETILYEDEYYQVNPAIDHEYDVEAFDSFVARAKTAMLPSERIRLYRKATELVTGPYLEDVGAVWIMPERERLHQAHIASLLSLGELLFREGEPIAALEACRHLLETEPTSEAGYRLKMYIHDRLGDKAALIRAYRECEASLEDVFGMAPSEETQALFRKLAA